MSQGEKRGGPENLFAQVINMARVLEYQTESIVSRTLVDRPGGTLTIFAFWEGQGLSEHTAPFDATVLLLDGEAEVTISGKPLTLKAGEMVIMPANKPHALKAITNFKMLLMMIKD